MYGNIACMQRNYNMKFKHTLIALLSVFCLIFASHPAGKLLWMYTIPDPVVTAPILNGSITCCVEPCTWTSFIFHFFECCRSQHCCNVSLVCFEYDPLELLKHIEMCHTFLMSLSWYKWALLLIFTLPLCAISMPQFYTSSLRSYWGKQITCKLFSSFFPSTVHFNVG